MKLCGKCNEYLPLDRFHRNNRRIDGRQDWCKNCKKEYKNSNRQKHNKDRKAWADRNKDKIRVHNSTNRMIERGELVRPEKCELCEMKAKTNAHHWDYTKPTWITWVCLHCHAWIHYKKEYIYL